MDTSYTTQAGELGCAWKGEKQETYWHMLGEKTYNHTFYGIE